MAGKGGSVITDQTTIAELGEVLRRSEGVAFAWVEANADGTFHVELYEGGEVYEARSAPALAAAIRVVFDRVGAK